MSKKKKRVSPMLGRKISKEKRGPNAPKLGRPFNYDRPVSKHCVTLSIPDEYFEKLSDHFGTSSKAKIVTKLMESELKKIK